MFLINLFIGVVFYNFSLAQKSSKHKYLTDQQVNWLIIQRLILKVNPKLSNKYSNNNILIILAFKIVKHEYFQYFMNFIILMSVILLSLTYEGSGKTYQNNLRILEYICTLIFTFEAFLHIFVYGINNYFVEGTNKIDFIILLSSYFYIFTDLFLNEFFMKISFGKPLKRFLICLRILWLLRLMRILKKIKDIKKLLKTLYISLPMTLNILYLLLIIMFIYTIFGCKFFGGYSIKIDSYLDNYINFDNFTYAIMTLFKISTADEWEMIMFDLMEDNKLAVLYFISFYIIISFIMINLFILILIEQFDEYYHNPDNPLHSFHDNLEDFTHVWSTLCMENNQYKISENQLMVLFRRLLPPLGKY